MTAPTIRQWLAAYAHAPRDIPVVPAETPSAIGRVIALVVAGAKPNVGLLNMAAEELAMLQTAARRGQEAEVRLAEWEQQ